ncbi:MAG: hypothetical protein ABH803_01690 [Candidatus Micrarchaeota archaeon]
MKLTSVLALLLVAGMVFLVFFVNENATSNSEGVVPSVSLPSEDFLTYEDKDYNFSFSYPIGYEINPSLTGGYLTVSSGVQGLPRELINFYLVESGFGVDALSQAVSKASIEKERVVGGDYYVTSSYFDSDLNYSFVVTGLQKQCPAFDLVVLTTVPEDLKEDSSVMDYVLSSVEC